MVTLHIKVTGSQSEFNVLCWLRGMGAGVVWKGEVGNWGWWGGSRKKDALCGLTALVRSTVTSAL
jgi:hypothetical protein